MIKLEALKKQFKKAVLRLEEALNQEKNDFMRDSCIQRFEFTFDLCWKLLKVILEEDHGVICHSPKNCIREAYQQKLINYDDFWLKIVEMRNQTSHMYKEEVASQVYKELPKVLSYFKKID